MSSRELCSGAASSLSAIYLLPDALEEHCHVWTSPTTWRQRYASANPSKSIFQGRYNRAVPLLVVDATDEVVVQVSDNLAEYLGLSPGAALGKPLADIINADNAEKFDASRCVATFSHPCRL